MLQCARLKPEPHKMMRFQRSSVVVIAATWAIAAALFASAAFADPPEAGEWHVLRTTIPSGGLEVAESHTADTARSDLDLAGLLLRCLSQNLENADQRLQPSPTSPAVIVASVTLVPPHAEPQVTVTSAGKQWHFAARVLPPGAELLLPPEAADLARTAWQSSHELTVAVSTPERSFSGVIPIDGLAAALATVAASCPASGRVSPGGVMPQSGSTDKLQSPSH